MFREHDIVRLKRDLAAESPQGWPDVPSTALEAGTRGTIVAIYGNRPADQAYEVEFVAEDGSTVGLLTLTGADIELVD